MIAKTVADYGGPFSGGEATEDPTGELTDDLGNRWLEDTAQLTQTAPRAIVHFTTRTSNGACTINFVKSMWPSASPVVNHVGTGGYTMSFGTPQVDSLGVSETVQFRSVKACVIGSTRAHATANSPSGTATFTIYTFNAAGTASDLSGTAVVRLAIR